MAAIVAMTVASAVVDAEDTVDASNDTADTRTDRASDGTTHRASRAVALANALVCAAFHTANDTLRMGRDRQRENSQRGGYEC